MAHYCLISSERPGELSSLWYTEPFLPGNNAMPRRMCCRQSVKNYILLELLHVPPGWWLDEWILKRHICGMYYTRRCTRKNIWIYMRTRYNYCCYWSYWRVWKLSIGFVFRLSWCRWCGFVVGACIFHNISLPLGLQIRVRRWIGVTIPMMVYIIIVFFYHNHSDVSALYSRCECSPASGNLLSTWSTNFGMASVHDLDRAGYCSLHILFNKKYWVLELNLFLRRCTMY